MSRKYGFTVIEILIVVVVIGILAGIGLVSYNGWRKETVRKAITSDLQNALSAAEQEKTSKGHTQRHCRSHSRVARQIS